MRSEIEIDPGSAVPLGRHLMRSEIEIEMVAKPLVPG
jgi:hypothetical protein